MKIRHVLRNHEGFVDLKNDLMRGGLRWMCWIKPRRRDWCDSCELKRQQMCANQCEHTGPLHRVRDGDVLICENGEVYDVVVANRYGAEYLEGVMRPKGDKR